MSNYPARMAAVIADFIIADGEQQGDHSADFAFLNGFAILKVERSGRGFRFDEVRQLDQTGTASATLLNALASQLDEDTSLCGHRLDKMVGSLVRVPSGDPNEAGCKPALLRLKTCLGNDVHDAHWYDRDRHRSLENLARDYDLPAEWHRRSQAASANMLERELSARAQTVWLSIAHEWLTTNELRRATADYDRWRTAHSIV